MAFFRKENGERVLFVDHVWTFGIVFEACYCPFFRKREMGKWPMHL